MQNPDGGWGYFPGKKSWLEPTIYAALALHGSAESDRAWKLISAWQNPDGGWRPSADVEISHAATALAVSAAVARGEFGEPFERGVKWLLGTAGNESEFYRRALVKVGVMLGLVEDQRDLSLKAWPWKPDTASWVEPTAHALVALKQAAPKVSESGEQRERVSMSELHERVRMGEAELAEVRCKDGGWNYGNKTARGDDLRSYPETTGIALVGLQGRSDLEASFDLAKRMLSETTLPMAKAWLTIAMRVNGIATEDLTGDASPDVLITALEALGAEDGNYQLLKVAA